MLSLKEGISIEADWVGMYFDAVVVHRSQKERTFIEISSGHPVGCMSI